MKRIFFLFSLFFFTVFLFAQKNIKGRYVYKMTGEFIRPYYDTLLLKKDGTFYRGRYSGLGTRRHLADRGSYTFANDSTLLLTSDPNPERIDFIFGNRDHTEQKLADSDSVTFEIVTPDTFAIPYLEIIVRGQEGNEKKYRMNAKGHLCIAEKDIKDFSVLLDADPARKVSFIYEPQYAVSRHVLVYHFERNIGLVHKQQVIIRRNSLVFHNDGMEFKPEFVKK